MHVEGGIRLIHPFGYCFWIIALQSATFWAGKTMVWVLHTNLITLALFSHRQTILWSCGHCCIEIWASVEEIQMNIIMACLQFTPEYKFEPKSFFKSLSQFMLNLSVVTFSRCNIIFWDNYFTLVCYTVVTQRSSLSEFSALINWHLIGKLTISDKIVETLYSNRVTSENKIIHTPPLSPPFSSNIGTTLYGGDGGGGGNLYFLLLIQKLVKRKKALF